MNPRLRLTIAAGVQMRRAEAAQEGLNEADHRWCVLHGQGTLRTGIAMVESGIEIICKSAQRKSVSRVVNSWIFV